MKDLLEKYKNEEVTFKGYYKYTFTYGNEKIDVSCGNDGSDIYKADLSPTMKLKDLIAECGDYMLDIREL